MLERVTTADPDNIEALNALGIAYARPAAAREALAAFERVLAVDPRDVFALENIGTVHLAAERPRCRARRRSRARSRTIRSRPARTPASASSRASRGRSTRAVAHWRTRGGARSDELRRAVNLATALLAADRARARRGPTSTQFVQTAPRGVLRARHRAASASALTMTAAARFGRSLRSLAIAAGCRRRHGDGAAAWQSARGRRPHHPHLHRHAARRSPAGLRQHAASQTPNIDALGGRRRAVRDTPTRIRRRRCPRTRRSCRASCHSSTAFATTSASRSRPASVSCSTRCASRVTRPAASSRPTCLRQQTGIAQGFDTLRRRAAGGVAGPAARPGAAAGGCRRWRPPRGGSTRRPRRRFFLFFHIYEPHTPYAPPPRFTADDPYDGEVEYADEIVGKLLEHLRQKDLYDNATIVLLADHGEGLGDHGEDEHGIFLYRETIHVPLVIKLPALEQRPAAAWPRRCSTSIWCPTVLALAGAARHSKAAAEGRGRSLLPADRSHRLAAARPDLLRVAVASLSLRLERAVCAERRRLSLHPRAEGRAVRPRAGPEGADVDRRGTAAGAQRHAARARRHDRAERRRRAASPVSDDDRQKLAALGYVGTQTRPQTTATTGATAAGSERQDSTCSRTIAAPLDLAARGSSRTPPRCSARCSARIRE